MERLTQRCNCGICGSNERVLLYPLYKIGGDEYMDYGLINQCFEKLAMYEDAEEQGLLLRLPCKVGDTVYVVKNNTDACDECNYFEEWYYDCVDYCSNKEVGKEDGNESFYPQYADEPICPKQFMEIFVKKATLEWTFNSRKQFGKTIFLTREEAEKALEKMKGEEHEETD